MKTTIIKIGNSKGVRIPKPVLDQCGLEDEVNMEVRGHELIIRPAHAARTGWDQAFQKMAGRIDDYLIDEVAEPSTEWADKDWEW